MTEKRFTITDDFEEHQYQIRDNGKILMGCFLKPQAEPIVALLNELHEENTALKTDRHRFEEEAKLFALSVLENEINEIKEENAELKSILKKIIYQVDIDLSPTPICSVRVQVNPEMYTVLTDLLINER